MDKNQIIKVAAIVVGGVAVLKIATTSLVLVLVVGAAYAAYKYATR